MIQNIVILEDRLAEFCRTNGIARLAVFGSALREDFGPQSDIDLQVEFEPGQTPGLGFVTMDAQLSDLLCRHVDILTRSSVERSRTISAGRRFLARPRSHICGKMIPTCSTRSLRQAKQSTSPTA